MYETEVVAVGKNGGFIGQLGNRLLNACIGGTRKLWDEVNVVVCALQSDLLSFYYVLCSLDPASVKTNLA
jgi:hypothetical protein